MAKIYSTSGKIMTTKEIAKWANTVHRQNGAKRDVFSPLDFVTVPVVGGMERLKGHHCDCGVDENGFSVGEFKLLPLDDESVVSGGKAYMICKCCGAYSHL